MILAYHAIFGTYGFWLPNDPRGSWSDYVRVWELSCLGNATKTDSRRSVAGQPHDHEKRLEAKESLDHPPVQFSGIQARAVGTGFAEAIRVSKYVIYACSIMPEHVHLVIARHKHKVEQVVRRLKTSATMQLKREKLLPSGPPSPWGRSCWKVFLDDEEGVRRAIRYVEENPTKENKPPQKWSFITPYHGERYI
ncbi:MAG: transposase [Planctomycetia bacterium]|jgi:REP element-mobilizing transposase RayT